MHSCINQFCFLKVFLFYKLILYFHKFIINMAKPFSCRMVYLWRDCSCKELGGTWRTPVSSKQNQCSLCVRCQRFTSSRLKPRDEAKEVTINCKHSFECGAYFRPIKLLSRQMSTYWRFVISFSNIFHHP